MIKKLLAYKLSKKQNKVLMVFGLFIFLGLAVVFKLQSLQKIFPVILVVLIVIVKDKSKSFTLTYLDVGFFLLLAGEITTALFSSHFINSLSSLTRFVVLFFLYILYKIILKRSKNISWITFLFFIFSSILLVLTSVSFLSFYKELNAHGFSELNNFKFLYYPLSVLKNGNLNNIWASVLLIFIPFNIVFLLKQKNKAVVFLVLLNLLLNAFCILVSFSRGVYLSLFVFILLSNLLLVKQYKFRQIVIYNGVALLLLASSAFLVKNSFLTTVSVNKTISQQRSTSGRLSQWEHAFQLVQNKPVFGYGQKNYRLAKEESPSVNEDVFFTPRINNTYLQVLIERGIFGLVFYILFFGIVALVFYKNSRNKDRSRIEKTEMILIISGIIALLVRDLTFSTLFDSDFVFFLAFYLIFAFVPYDIEIAEIRITRNRKAVFLLLCFLLISAIIYLNARRSVMVKFNNTFVKSYYENDNSQSLSKIDEALHLYPTDFILNKQKALALSKNAFKIDVSEKNKNLLFVSEINMQALNLALNHYQKVLETNPFDDEIIHNIAWIYFILNNQEKSKYYFDKALELNPFQSLFHISAVFYNLKYFNKKEAINSLSKALRYSPDLLESEFYKALSAKHSEIAEEAKQEAISGLKTQLETGNNLIMKARLARLLLNEKPKESFLLLEEITAKLPNLNRPWTYLAYLNSAGGNAQKTEKYFENAVFFNPGDFLSKLYYAEYCREKGDDEMASNLFRSALKLYRHKRPSSRGSSISIAEMDIIPNAYLVSDLLYYINPRIEASGIFEYLSNYFSSQNNQELAEHYKNLAKKYKDRIYMGDENIR